jgi:predicted Fe-Mo cluster-binding NifX family protein
MEIIYGTRTISGTETTCRTTSGMETIICGMTGKNTFSLTLREIGIAIGTAIATTGGTVTDALLLMDRG